MRNGIALCKLHHWAFDNGWSRRPITTS
ncbi:hypothetical protein C9J85_12745 [Haloferax sp. wsp5]|nr:hypothetical protein C9J85_12745 [Haloferax sp. wsp5]